MADFKGAWELEPREIYEKAAMHWNEAAFHPFKLALTAKTAIRVAKATENLGGNIVQASGELKTGITDAARLIAEAGRAQERYAASLGRATWALVAATAALVGVGLLQLWASWPAS